MLLARKGWLAGLLSVAVLAGCASSDDESEQISPLPELDQNLKVDVQWKERVGKGIEDYWSSLSPAIAYDKLFVAERHGIVSALSPEDGKEIWSTNLRRAFSDGMLKKNKGARLSGGVATGFNKVFVGSENGAIFALNAEDGSVAWETTTVGEVLSDPAIIGRMVVANTAAGKVQAFNVDNGEFVWQMDLTMPPLMLRGSSGVASSQGAAIFGTPDGKVSALFADSGAPIWEARLAEATGSNELERVVDVDVKPVVRGDNVYSAAFNGNLASIELRSGRIAWSRKYSSYTPLAIQGFQIYMTDSRGAVYSIDRRNGLENWANTELTGRLLTGPQTLGNYLVVGDFEGYLHVLDRQTGELLGYTQIDSSGLYAQPLRDGDKLYLQTRSGRVAAVTIP
ncbi:outer membrane protein assembly factor BamB [Ferrimonas marina]|uniref:Outer membrane protein assembly factor BamB n=1 Tax=Ferrimonas marina TaxID=299255 RepID=A0A1M5S3Q6_9GAMM|nr:outer membrane protein assembly factor BamB [Ferrimonas marina]SHH33121.1 Beta-barrel assembly machine subunit BamB [Ferrimonas marina]